MATYLLIIVDPDQTGVPGQQNFHDFQRSVTEFAGKMESCVPFIGADSHIDFLVG
jgi:hypothetical protein